MIKRGMVIRDGGWTGYVSAIVKGTVIGSDHGAGPGDSRYACRAWPEHMITVTKTGCSVNRSLATKRSPVSPAVARHQVEIDKIKASVARSWKLAPTY